MHPSHALAMALLLALCGCRHDTATSSPAAGVSQRASQKVDDRVREAADAAIAGTPPADYPTDGARLRVYLRCAQGDEARQRLQLDAAGLRISAFADVGTSRLIEGSIEASRIDALARLDFVERISPPREGRHRQ